MSLALTFVNICFCLSHLLSNPTQLNWCYSQKIRHVVMWNLIYQVRILLQKQFVSLFRIISQINR
jgi:hypothetical protein